MENRRTTFATSLLVAAVLALAVTAYLAWLGFSEGLAAGCDMASAFDCDAILASHWAAAFGVPVAAVAVVAYLAILALLWPSLRHPGGLAMTGLLMLSLSAMLAAIWMIALQALVLQEFCLYCVVAHACGLIVGVSALGLAAAGRPERDPGQMKSLLGVASVEQTPAIETGRGLSVPRVTAAVLIAVSGVAAMAAGQYLGEEPAPELEEIVFAAPASEPSLPAEQTQLVEAGVAVVEEEPARPQEAALGEAEVRDFTFTALADPIRLSDAPILGSPHAEHVVVELIDYTCKHCRQLHPYVQQAVERYDGRLAVVVLPVPLSSECNPYAASKRGARRNSCDYAQLALGVWRFDHVQFAEFHDWLMQGERPPRLTIAVRRAVDLLGDRFLIDPTRKQAAQRVIAGNCEVGKNLGGTLPLLVLPNSASRGVPKSAAELFRLLEGKLDLQPPAARASP